MTHPTADSTKLLKVIQSCKTPEQFDSAREMVYAFRKKWRVFSSVPNEVNELGMYYLGQLDALKNLIMKT